jgi:hypothetical protein
MEEESFPDPFLDPSSFPTLRNARHFHPELVCLRIPDGFDRPCALAHLSVCVDVRQVVIELCGGSGGEYEFLKMRAELPTVCAVEDSGGGDHERFGLREELLESRPRDRCLAPSEFVGVEERLSVVVENLAIESPKP